MTKIALVTGANKGIGKEIARQLVGAGYEVLLGSRDLARGEAAAKEVGATAIQLAVTDPESVEQAAAAIAAEYGRLDVLVNNAAIIPAGDAGVVDIAPGVLRDGFETNVVGLVGVTQAMLPLLRKAPQARVVNMSTELASFTSVGDPASRMSTVRTLGYNSTKAAVNMVTVMLANELRGSGILVNAADPGNCATDMGGWDAGRTAAQGAAVAVRLATLAADGPTGEVYAEAGRLPW
ncbi:SDR family NAD(P)-dependent oxidoreductase [Kribbella sandramycini]|uniref:NAD(P)-dependent dehydrogenase (Short-subunit alcohol dehydrogenase family) n=1 Tax=Kribbella sandramycini TaxID=60450 RepID=A0A7Y4NZB5_9ACTN|nr:SDR family NAD(P)-dependent oxidoreductase [Kribbella sandramycini]MBB6567392.1 NAD(P)-dependent dehydrogenase (short-subunit alcohol dehydrogenase family) [Kribbella sandramycini]NOL39995.1 SDR family NAD(P)-dependent oxidoreductase [Kribbella sandramycini]